MKDNNTTIDFSKRTKGEYNYEINKMSRHGEILIRINELIIARVSPEATDTDEENEANAAFICHAVNNFERLEQENKKLKSLKYNNMKKVTVKKARKLDGDMFYRVYSNNEHIKSFVFKENEPEDSLWNENKALTAAMQFAQILENENNEVEETIYETPSDKLTAGIDMAQIDDNETI